MEENLYDEFGNYIGPELSENVIRFNSLHLTVHRKKLKRIRDLFMMKMRNMNKEVWKLKMKRYLNQYALHILLTINSM